MPVLNILDYYKAVDIAVRKYAKDKSEEEKQDIRQNAYLALLEAGTRVKNLKIAYLIASDSVIQYLYRGQGKLIIPDSLSDESVKRTVEEQCAIEFDSSDGIDIDKIATVVDKLSSDEQGVIILYFYTDYTIEDIAQILGKPVIWVKRKKSLALQKLKKLLKVK